MRIIGVTGGIGAGKSTVLELLKEEYGAELLMADAIGRELQEPGGACYEAMRGLFGEGCLLEDGTFDRKQIAAQIFSDEVMKEKLNAIVHPAVRAEIERRLGVLAWEGQPIAVIESAILFEAGYETMCDEVWIVTAEPQVRIGRLMESRGYTKEKCLQIMKNQPPEEKIKTLADHVIENNTDLDAVKKQIAGILPV